jgi:hypothetical protein
MTRHIVFVVCALALASSAMAQSKITGTVDCDKVEPAYQIPIPDREGVAFAMSQARCTWPKHSPIEGLQATEFVNTNFLEVTGASARSTANGVTRYDNGDKLFTRSTGTNDLKALTGSGKWTIVGGTGKLIGLKGGGTYTCKMKGSEPSSGYVCEIQGEYTPAAAKK